MIILKVSGKMPFHMIINLDYNRDIYLGKDTIMAYTHEKEKSCESLEVNEVVESTEFQTRLQRKVKVLLNPILCFSSSSYRTLPCGAEDQTIS